MTDQDGSQLADRSNAFLRQLSARAEIINGRFIRFAGSGWDVNGLALIHADAGRLAESSAMHGLDTSAEPLRAIAELLRQALEQEQLPDQELGERLCELARTLREQVPWAPPIPSEAFVPIDLDLGLATGEATLRERDVLVEEGVDAWGDSAPLFGRLGSKNAADSRDALPPRPKAAARAPAKKQAAPALAAVAERLSAVPSEVTTLAVPPDFRVYHLSGHGALALDLDRQIRAQGLEIELLENVGELNELLSALPADLVLIDACFNAQLESIGATVRLARTRSNTLRVLLVAIAEADDIALRLSARRAGVDALLVDPQSASEVLKRVQLLVDPEREDPYRVLIVEDDRGQALFAEGILRNAGMDSLVVIDALDVMPALEQFRPDLILMDLNMPGASGIELTALIREQEAFAHTPIVFLSGESSEDLQFDAIDAGGDDFLSKPIRPRHLIATVQTRVRRYRQQENRQVRRPDKDAATGLAHRSGVLEQLDECLQRGQRNGGLVFLELESVGLLRERIGLTALETLLGDVSRLLAGLAADLPVTRFGDGSFLLLDRQRDEPGLDLLAAQLRQALMQSPLQVLGHPLRLRLSVGICAFRHDFSGAGAMINAVEKVAREARTDERGVRRFEPPSASDALKEAALLTQVRDAIDQDSLVLLYQPVVAVAGHDVSQYQALLRLRDSNGKLRSAAEIIPMAERTSLIVEIDRWVMIQALALIRERLAEDQSLRLFVTQSPFTLGAPGQSDWLKAEIAGNGVPGASLVVELRLEDVAVHAGTVRQFCEAMVADGVQFCLSQFEAGADTEALIDQLPLRFVKLARKYTAGNLTPALRDELKNLIGRAHRRHLQVIGHGVEDAQAAATLWMSGIDFIQGNLVQQADQDTNFDFSQQIL